MIDVKVTVVSVGLLLLWLPPPRLPLLVLLLWNDLLQSRILRTLSSNLLPTAVKVNIGNRNQIPSTSDQATLWSDPTLWLFIPSLPLCSCQSHHKHVLALSRMAWTWQPSPHRFVECLTCGQSELQCAVKYKVYTNSKDWDYKRKKKKFRIPY